jgi:signal peptidase I
MNLLRLAVVVVASGLALITARLVSRYVVEGRSMLQAYAAGDRLIVEGLSYRLRSPRVGEVVVVRRAGAEGRLDLKRVFAGPGSRVNLEGMERRLGADDWFLLGDNLSESTDSRQLGPVKRREIIGRVWFRY